MPQAVGIHLGPAGRRAERIVIVQDVVTNNETNPIDWKTTSTLYEACHTLGKTLSGDLDVIQLAGFTWGRILADMQITRVDHEEMPVVDLLTLDLRVLRPVLR